MSELGELTKTLAKRKDMGRQPIKLGDFFKTFDRTASLEAGLTQSETIENSGVLRGVAQPSRLQGLYHPVFDLTYPPGPRGEGLIMIALTPDGKTYASEGSLPAPEGGKNTRFELWTELKPQIWDRASVGGKIAKKVLLTELRKHQAQPFPPRTSQEMKEINFAIR